MSTRYRPRYAPLGFTLIEGIIVTAVMSILFAVGLVAFRGFSNPLENQHAELVSLIRLTRIKAMQNTAAYRLSGNGGLVRVEFANNCSATTWSTDASVGRDIGGGARGLQLSDGVSMTPSAWTICFNSRGSLGSATNLNLTLSRSGQTRGLQVLLGGGVVEP